MIKMNKKLILTAEIQRRRGIFFVFKPINVFLRVSVPLCFFLTSCFLLPTLSYAQELPYSVRNITDGGQVDFHPDFRPDGKELVFASRSEISKDNKEFWNISPYHVNLWLKDSNGNNRRQLTTGKVIDCYPSFTPDGEKVLFVSNRGGQWDVWSIKRDGSGLIRLTDNQDKDYSPRATPDGKHILFFSTPTSSEAGYITESVWIMDMDGKNAKRLTSGGKGDWYPSMSPDGKDIIFASMRLIGGSLWTIDREGKNYRRLTYGKVLEFFPNWSPDGKKIAYVSRREHASFDTVGDTEKDPLEIWIMDKDGNNKRQLTKNISGGIWDSRFNLRKPIDFISYYHTSWHPDGTKIALTTWEKEQKGSYISIIEFNKDTLNKLPVLNEDPLPEYTLVGERELTGGEWEDFGPSFSPDGNTIVFSSNRAGNWDILSIGADGEGLRQLTKGDDDELAPVYSPDGKEIAFLKSSKELLSAYDIWVMKSDGSGARQVTEGFKVISYPAWNPQSNEIAFVSKEDKGPEIQLISLSKVGQEVVNTVSRVISMWDTQKPNPVMFPFAKEEEQREFNPHKIMKMKKMVQEENKNERKVWSEELLLLKKIFEIPYPLEEFLYKIDYNTTGDRLIFESNQTGNINIWSVKRDGTGLTHLTKGDGTYLNPVFSPNNSKVAYTRKLNRRSEFDYNTSES